MWTLWSTISTLDADSSSPVMGAFFGNFWAKQLLAGSVLFVDAAEVVGLP